MAKVDVLVLGDYCLDLVFTGLPGMPELGKEIVSTGFAILPGGTYNTAACLHRLGVKVGWAGDFGSDDFSQLVLRHAREEGLDDSLFVLHDRPMQRITVAASYPEERAFIAYYDPTPAVPAAVKALASSTARVVFIPGIYTGGNFAAGVRLIRIKHMALFMDGNSYEETLDDKAVCKSIAACDVFLPNRREALRLTGQTSLEKALERLSTMCPYIVVKDGANGAVAVKDGETYAVPGLEIKPRDTTGAGDAFNAGFITAWLDGKSLLECLQWGNIAGGLSTLGRGGTGRYVSRSDIHKALGKLAGTGVS